MPTFQNKQKGTLWKSISAFTIRNPNPNFIYRMLILAERNEHFLKNEGLRILKVRICEIELREI